MKTFKEVVEERKQLEEKVMMRRDGWQIELMGGNKFVISNPKEGRLEMTKKGFQALQRLFKQTQEI